MKRTVLKWGVALAACASVFYLGACGDTGDDIAFDGRQDTVLTLDAPLVTAKAYPGRNIVSWEPVTGAQGYTVHEYEAGVWKRSDFYTDCVVDFTSLVNNMEYTYYVEAMSDSNPASAPAERGVFVQNSRSSASVKAIVPPVGTKALDLAAYEDGYDGKTVKTLDATKDEYVLTKDRVKLELDAKNGQVYVDFPMKAYLKYTVKYYDTSIDHAVAYSYTPVFQKGGKVNNVIGRYPFTIMSGGTYEVVMVVESTNTSAYPASDEIVVGKVEVKKLNLAPTSTYISVDADYLYNSLTNKTVRVKFNQLKKADGSTVPADWYKVYRRVMGEYEATLVTATINSNSESFGYGTYYLDDTVPDVTVQYEYTVVVTNGEAYASLNGNTTTISVKHNYNSPWLWIYGSPSWDKDYNLVYNSVDWEIQHNNVAKSAITAYVLVEDDDRRIDYGYLNSEIEAKGKNVTNLITTKEGYSGTYFLTTANLTDSTSTEVMKAYLLVVVKESGKDEYREVCPATFYVKSK